MASIPVYLLKLGGQVIITYLAYKALEKLRREYSWYSSSESHDVPVGPGANVVFDCVHARDWYTPPSVPPVVGTGATVVHDRVSSTEDVRDHVSYTEDVPDHVSTEDAPVSVETLEEEVRTVGIEDNNKDNEDEDDDFNEDNMELDSLVREAKDKTPDAICYNHLVTGTCRDGSNCGYPHPPRKENQCYLRSGGCKFGKACRYRHLQENPVVPPPLDFNFLGLPIRPGQKKCTYYMRDGCCKYGSSCRFHHPDPTVVAEGDVPSGSFSLHPSGVLLPASTSWSSPPNETVPYLDAANHHVPMMLPPQGLHHNAEWNGYQCERVCPYYMCAGSCKYGPNCSFHHPDPTSVGGGDIPSGSFSLNPSGASQPASTSWSSPPNETVPYLDPANHFVPMMLPPQGVHQNLEWNGYLASLRPNGAQPLLAANRNPLGWNKPKTNPAVNGTSSKGAKKTKIGQSSWCSICMIDCQSKVVLDQHKLGKKHKENLEKLEEPKKRASASPAKHPAVGPKESSAADKGKTVIVQSVWREIRKIDGERKNVLDLPKLGEKHNYNLEKLDESKKEASAPAAATVAHAAKHLTVGSKESPAANKSKTVGVQQWKEKAAPSLGRGEDLETVIVKSVCCEICKIECTSQIDLDQHKLGKKHKKNLEKLEELKREVRAANHPVVGSIESPAADKGKTVGVQQSKEKGAPSLGAGEDLNIQMTKLMEGGAAASALWLCEVCSVVCDSQTVFDDHLAGQKHANLVKKQVVAAGKTNPSDPFGGFYFIEDEHL
ncbi:hypothetical protein NE237_021016 [Protea cynaroides]|uniref:C3H1-type domain-containing protein n=1 Tax=Protea cynaroides TaxID=273540 RepID=A0A9Q0H9J5_9MAGN|nr:hypothetical protein NE237_021016 [Protea cynaroides]